MQKYALISLLCSLITVGLKFYGYYLTKSIGLLSDGLESIINIVASLILIWTIYISKQPADHKHHYGHGKAEYFSSAFEGLLIMLAGGAIIFECINRFHSPVPITNIFQGIVFSGLATLLNLITGVIILKGARKLESIALEADAKHILADVKTTLGVMLGLVIIYLSNGRYWFADPLVGLAIALNIIWEGFELLKRSFSGLMDESLSEEELQTIIKIIEKSSGQNKWHGLKTRKAGTSKFIEFHLLFPGNMALQHVHDLCCIIENNLYQKFPNAQIIIHPEPEEDIRSWDSRHAGGINPEFTNSPNK